MGVLVEGMGEGAEWVQTNVINSTPHLSPLPSPPTQVFDSFMEQATLANEVALALLPPLGGTLSAPLDSVLAAVARSGTARSYASSRQALQLNATFVVAQLDKAAARMEVSFRKCPAYKEIAEMGTGLGYRVEGAGGGVRIAEGGEREKPKTGEGWE